MLIKNEDMNIYKERVEVANLFGLSLMETSEFERVDIIINNLGDYNFLNQERKYRFDISRGFNNATNFISSIYGDRRITSELREINKNEDGNIQFIQHNTDNVTFLTQIGFIHNGKEFNKQEGFIFSYTFPEYVYKSSDIFLAHELNHALKDRNYEEFISQFTFGEIIPLFFELLSIEKIDKECKKSFLQERMYILKENCKMYLEAKSRMSENEKIFTYIKSDSGKYANAFYYALILYDLYKKKPKQVLDEVKRVLKRIQTTEQMLNKLGIHGINDSYEIVTKELDKINKLVLDKRK